MHAKLPPLHYSKSRIRTTTVNPGCTVGRLWGATYRVSLRSSAMIACSCIVAKENNPLLLRVFTGGMPHMKSKSVTDFDPVFLDHRLHSAAAPAQKYEEGCLRQPVVETTRRCDCILHQQDAREFVPFASCIARCKRICAKQ